MTVDTVFVEKDTVCFFPLRYVIRRARQTNIEVHIPFKHHHEPSVFLPFAKVVATRKWGKGLGLRVLLRVDSLHDRVALKRLGELDHRLHYI